MIGYVKRNRAVLAVAALVFALGVVLGWAVFNAAAARASSSRGSEQPPQCFTVRILEPGAARALWVAFCGTGSAGTSPLEEGVSGHGPLVVDGASLTPANCVRRAPCVVLWPNSPPLP